MTEPRYLFDTNILSHIVRNPRSLTAKRLDQLTQEAVYTSIIVACELRYGIMKRGSATLSERVEGLLARITVLPLEPDADRHYGDIRCELERQGQPIGSNDFLIAAHARALGLILVTDNTWEFSRVPNLTVENWLAEEPKR